MALPHRFGRVLLLFFALRVLTLAAPLARADDRNPDSFRASSPPPARQHQPSETRIRVGSAIASPQFRALRTYLLDRGFTPRVDLAASGETLTQGGPDDGEILFIPFQAQRQDDRTAVVHFGRRGSATEWGATILAKNGSDVDAVDKVVVDGSGAVVTAHSWWSCFKYNVLVFCGAGALGCMALWWAGPNAVITCAVGLCGPVVLSFAIYCIGR
jgi:hypothetical protein